MQAIEGWIRQGVDCFYVGHQGEFDRRVLGCLVKLRKVHPHISYTVVLAYLPTERTAQDLYAGCSMVPEGVEQGLPRFAIERRNRWLIAHGDCCIVYVNRTFGGAYKFAKLAKRKGMRVLNLGAAALG